MTSLRSTHADRHRIRRARAGRRAGRCVLGGVTIPIRAGSPGTPTPTCCCTRSATRSSARSRWATSACTFPTPIARWKGADSRVLLRHVAALVARRAATRSATSTPRSSRRRRSSRRTSRRCARTSRPTSAAPVDARVASRPRRPSAWASPGARKASPRWRSCCSSAHANRTQLAVARAGAQSAPQASASGSCTRAIVPPPSRGSRSKRAAVQARDAIDDREPESGAGRAVGRARAPRSARVNGCFSRSTSLRRDAGAAIGHVDDRRACRRPRSSPRPAARRRRARCRRGCATRREMAVGRSGSGGSAPARKRTSLARART